MGKTHVGKLLKPLVLDSEVDGKEAIIVYPKGCIVEVHSEEEYPHTVTSIDIEDAIDEFDNNE